MILVNSPETINNFRVVQDYDEMVQAMRRGESVYHWEFGNSMSPMFPNKGYCFVSPIDDINEIEAGDAVLCRLNGYLMVHMVWQVSHMDREKPHFLIGSTGGSLYGWTSEVYGQAIATPYIEDVEEPKEEEDESDVEQ